MIEETKPFKVRASCGHIEIRRMREDAAGEVGESEGDDGIGGHRSWRLEAMMA